MKPSKFSGFKLITFLSIEHFDFNIVLSILNPSNIPKDFILSSKNMADLLGLLSGISGMNY